MSQVIEISKSDLAGARDTGNKEYLISTFQQAEDIIKAGGSVHFMQVFSDASKEIADVVDNLEQLNHYRNRYIR